MRHHGGEIIIYADGALQPERAGVGIIVLNRSGDVIALVNRTLPLMTNNEAEYAGLILALETAAVLGAETVEVRLDSEVVVGQMTGRWAVNSPKLKPIHRQACEQARAFSRVRYLHIPRERNSVADALASEAAAGRIWRSQWTNGENSS